MAYTGGCQCGAIRYACQGAPTVAYCCHCTDCQRQSSSAFGISVWFPAETFTLTRGAPGIWTTQGGSGAAKHCAFCPNCGTRIYHIAADTPDSFSVKGGTLDMIRDITPVGHIWVRSALPWIRPQLAGEVCHETEPESFDGLVERFRRLAQ